MEIYRSLNGLSLSDSCVTIGVFDGVHRGHLAVLRATAKSAQGGGVKAVALTFDRHPAELLAPQHAPTYVASLEQRLEWLSAVEGLDSVVVVAFNLSFANMTPRQFVENVLVQKLDTREVLVGADFRFGKNRAGSVMDLEAAAETHGFTVTIVHPIATEGERVSSTRIRELIVSGSMEAAERLLGRPVTLRGTVAEGKRLGRTIGFPTANLALQEPRQAIPAHGVYAGRVTILGAETGLPAAVSVGANPTTDGDSAPTGIEAYIMGGFDRDIYGHAIDIEFVACIRQQRKFDSLEALTTQITADVAAIAELLGAPR